jgi:hypothetical protein
VQPTLDLLRKLVSELSKYQIFIVSPITRYISSPCCNAEDHVANSGDPEFFSSTLSGLTKLKFLLKKKLALATLLDGIELICGAGCGRERMEQTLRTGWADPVHPKPHIYSKMALNLIEKVAAAGNTAHSQKQKRSDSSDEASSSRERQVACRRGLGQQRRLLWQLWPLWQCRSSKPAGIHCTHGGTTPKGAIGQPKDTPATTTRGPPRWAEVLTEAEGMPEAEATVESETAATTWEVSLTEGERRPWSCW